MNRFFLFLLLVAFSLSTTSPAGAQSRPKGNLKRAFSHNSGAGGKNNKAHFRRESLRPVIDLNPHSLEKFKTAKAGHHYKFAKGH